MRFPINMRINDKTESSKYLLCSLRARLGRIDDDKWGGQGHHFERSFALWRG